MKTLKFVSLLTVLAFILSSCGNQKGKSGETSTEEFNLQQYIETAEAITPSLNSIDQYYKILDLADAQYYPVLSNDPYKAHDYKKTYPIASANLGVYLIDVIYHVYGDAIETAYLSFAAAQELARFIGVEGAFAAMTFDAFEGSSASRDTMVLIYNDLMVQSENYASEAEILYVHTVFLVGVYAEKVHIISSLIQQSLKSENLTQEDEIHQKELLVIYLNQLKSVDVLLTAVEAQIEQIKSVVVLEQFQKLRELATSIEAEEEKILSMTQAELKKNENLNASFETVSKIRSLIVSSL